MRDDTSSMPCAILAYLLVAHCPSSDSWYLAQTLARSNYQLSRISKQPSKALILRIVFLKHSSLSLCLCRTYVYYFVALWNHAISYFITSFIVVCTRPGIAFYWLDSTLLQSSMMRAVRCTVYCVLYAPPLLIVWLFIICLKLILCMEKCSRESRQVDERFARYGRVRALYN